MCKLVSAHVSTRKDMGWARGWGLTLSTLHNLPWHSEESDHLKLDSGLPGCHEGIFGKLER